MSRRNDDDALFGMAASSGGPGPVYQGVCRQIRHLFPANDEQAKAHKDSMSGTIAQARSLAASIDRVSGHQDARAQANGVPLAAMHAQLDAVLERLAGRKVDAFQQLLDEINAEEVSDRDGTTETPHPAE